MSTRTNIVLQFGESRVFIYRHCDGYPSCTGEHIARLLTEHKRANPFLRALMAAEYEGTSYDPKPRPIYELTTGIHGDIEWLYVVKFDNEWSNPPKPVEVGCRPFGFSDEDYKLRDSYLPAMLPLGSLADFVTFVNAQIGEANERMKTYFKGRNYEPQELIPVAV